MALFSGKRNAKARRLEKFRLGKAEKFSTAIGFLFFVIYFRVILLFTQGGNMYMFVDVWGSG